MRSAGNSVTAAVRIAGNHADDGGLAITAAPAQDGDIVLADGKESLAGNIRRGGMA